jgi:YVTN family beta-propeller protein
MAGKDSTEFRLLGLFEVLEGGRPIDVGTAKQRALLALLLLNAGQVVSTDRVIDALWGERAPASALNSVRVYVSHLRKALGSERLRTRGRGYLLVVEREQLDLGRFERLLGEGRQALTAGEAARAAEILREALALWRGSPLEDFASESFAQTEIARLEELRLAALEERIEADLALGRHAELVPELEALVRGNPLRERLWAQLMLALYRADRQAEALEAYRHARRTLVEELGLEPGRRLQDLERAMLSHDHRLEPPPSAAMSRGAAHADPRARTRRSARRALLAAIAAAVLAALVVAGILATRPAGNLPPQSLQVLAADSVAVIDSRASAVVAEVPVGGIPAGIAVGEGAVWVGNSEDQTLLRIEPKTRKVVKRIGLGVKPWRIVVAAGAVWVASYDAKALLRIDPLYNEVTDRIDVSRAGSGVGRGDLLPPVAIAAGEGAIWIVHAFVPIQCSAIACGGVVSRVSTSARAVVRRIRVDSPNGIAFGDRAVWALSGPGRLGVRGALSRIDPKTNAVVWTTRMPSVGRLIAPIGLAFGEGAVWVMKHRIRTSDGALFEFDPGTGQLGGVLRIAGNPWGIAVSEGAVWVLTRNGTVVRVRPATSSVVDTIPLGRPPRVVYPNEIAAGEDAVWVTMH